RRRLAQLAEAPLERHEVSGAGCRHGEMPFDEMTRGAWKAIGTVVGHLAPFRRRIAERDAPQKRRAVGNHVDRWRSVPGRAKDLPIDRGDGLEVAFFQ